MHASLNELLTLRDEVVVDGEVAAHVRECEECRAELERLRELRAQLCALPDRMTPPDRWEAVQQALRGLSHPGPLPLEGQREEGARPSWKWPVAAAAAVMMSVVLLSLPPGDKAARMAESGDSKAQATAAAQAPAQMNVDPGAFIVEPAEEPELLMAQARELERMLSVFPDEPLVISAGTALTLAELQDRLQWVDYRLAMAEEAGLELRQAEPLWRERVDLLNSLVAVRYAQARTSF